MLHNLKLYYYESISPNNPLIQKYYFDDNTNAGFISIRIPITWKDQIF